MAFDTCQTSRSSIQNAFKQIVWKLDTALDGLIVIADAVDGNLLELEGHLGLIRDLLAEEAGMITTAREELAVSNFWSWVGWHSEKYLRYERRLVTVNSIRDYRRVTSQYVGGVRGSLRQVTKELKVLKQLVTEHDKSQGIVFQEAFASSLRLGVLRLRDAQMSVMGRDGRDMTIAMF